MKYLKSYNESKTNDLERTVDDISLDLLDKGLNADISWTPWSNDYLDCDIILWKHNGDEWHIPFVFDQDCIDFALRINDYMISNGLYLVKSTIVQSGSEPNRRSSDMDKTIKILSSLPTVEEIYFNFSNHYPKELKSYNESNIEPALKEIEQDVNDMLLDIQDEGLTCKNLTNNDRILFYIESDKGDWPHLFEITDNIKDTLERVSEYISETEYGISISSIGSEHIDLFYENGKWIDLDDHKDIQLLGRQTSLLSIKIR